MRHASVYFRYISLLFCALLLSCFVGPTAAFAQHHGPKYVTSTEVTVTGVVDEIKIPDGPHELVRVTFVIDGAKVDALLAPEKFLKLVDFEAKKGEKLKLIASKIKEGETEVLLVRVVTRDKDDYTLRGPDGSPAW